MKTRLNLCSLLSVLLSAAARADEGMWMPQQIPQLAERLKAMGFRGDPQAFADLTGQPMGAIVSLGGCSASFVSPDGLIVTNHHCVQGALQFNSTPQKNLMEDGFLATTRDQELTAGPGSRVYVTTSVGEVTDEITGKIDPKLDDRARHDVIEKRVKERTAACEKDGLRCRVASFFDGLKYFELAQMEIQDVRLVYAPAEGIGNFGGETDNWQWPRHTGDWSFYRAYVSPSGQVRAVREGERPLQAEALAQGLARRRRSRRPRLRGRLSGAHAALRDVRADERAGRVDVPAHRPPEHRADRPPRRSREEEQGDGDPRRDEEARAQQHAHEPQGRRGGLQEGQPPRRRRKARRRSSPRGSPRIRSARRSTATSSRR